METQKTGIVTTFVLLALIVIFIASSAYRNASWANDYRLWVDAEIKSPMKARPHNELGLLFAKSKRFDIALKELERAFMLWPTNYKILSNLGNMYSIFGRDDEAIRAYTTVLANVPRHTSTRFNLALLYLRKGMKKEAAAEFEAILKVKPEDQEAAYLLSTIK